MTLRPCYRATCDAPGCTEAAMLSLDRAGPARAALEALGWTVIPHHETPIPWRPVVGVAEHLCLEHYSHRRST